MHKSREGVRSLIESGRLQAYDANPDGENRQWRVTPESLEAFMQGTTTQSQTRRRRAPAETVKEFF